MILTILKRIDLIVVVAAVAGCKLYMAGHSADYGLIVNGVGDLDVNTKIMAFRLTYQGTDITCSGYAHERADGVKEMTGGFTCSDGRKAMGKSRLVSMNGAESLAEAFGKGLSRRAIPLERDRRLLDDRAVDGEERRGFVRGRRPDCQVSHNAT